MEATCVINQGMSLRSQKAVTHMCQCHPAFAACHVACADVHLGTAAGWCATKTASSAQVGEVACWMPCTIIDPDHVGRQQSEHAKYSKYGANMQSWIVEILKKQSGASFAEMHFCNTVAFHHNLLCGIASFSSAAPSRINNLSACCWAH